MDTKFRANLKAVRKEKNLTQRQVAEQLGVVESCYANWEQGRTEPDISTLRRLSLIFEVSIDYLAGLEDDFGVRASAPMSDDLTAEEKEMIKKIRTLRKESRELVEQMIDTLAGTEKAEQKKQA